MRALCCAVYTMKGSGLGRCSMQHAGGCLIHNLYPLTFSVATTVQAALSFLALSDTKHTIDVRILFNTLFLPSTNTLFIHCWKHCTCRNGYT